MTPHEVVRRLIAETIGASVGDRIRPNRRYQEDQLPAAVYILSDVKPRVALDGSRATQYSGEIVIWSADCRQAAALAAELAAKDGTIITNQDHQWFWVWVGGGFDVELVEEETDRPEYQSTIRFLLWCT